jgi:hypothetical protein
VRRFAVAFAVVPFILLLAAAPVSADTGPGGSGTFFFTFSETCSISGTRQVCTDTNLNVSATADGTSACLDVFTYADTGTRFTFISDQFGCTADADMTVGSDYSVTVAPVDIALASCKAHQRQCTGSSVVTVSAQESLAGDVATTTTRSTTVVGGCTYRTTTKETDADLAGTLTISGTALDAFGFIQIVDQTSTSRCK